MPVWCTKMSPSPSSGVMKPYPFSSLNHFTVPWAMSGAHLSLLGLHCNKKPLLSLRAALLTHHKTHIYLLHPYYTTSKVGARKPRPASLQLLVILVQTL